MIIETKETIDGRTLTPTMHLRWFYPSGNWPESDKFEKMLEQAWTDGLGHYEWHVLQIERED